MQTFTQTKSGLPGIMLVIVIAWALAAVMMLTGTLLNAREINRRVKDITHSVSSIDKDTVSVELATKTNTIAGHILTAAAPLSGQLGQVISAAGNINTNAGHILNKVGPINTKVLDIGKTVGAIHGTVGSIHSNVSGIHSDVSSIHNRVSSILSNATDINGTVHSILSNGTTILGQVHDIDAQVAGINRRADTVIGAARGIRDDLANVLTEVGTSHGANVRGHANSIDCARLFQALGRTEHCGQ